MARYFSTQYPGVRYREHKTRKYNGKPDRYFFIRYKRSGKSVEEAVGWASQGMNAQKATKTRSELIENIKLGKAPQTLREKRRFKEARRIEEEKQQQQDTLDQFTLDELAKRYIDWAKQNKKSWRDDIQRYNSHLKPVLGNKPLIKITSFDIEKLKSTIGKKFIKSKSNKTAQTLSPATVKHCLVLTRQMFNKAILWGFYSGQNPVKKVKLPKLNNVRLRFLSYEEADILLNELRKKSLQVYEQAILSVHCGLRFGEIANLTLADLDFNHEIIQIRDPKGHSRQAYMTEEVKAILLARAPQNATDLVYPSKRGTKQQYVSNTFDRTVAGLGFNNGITDRRDKLVFHSLRHTFGSWLAIQGTPILTIKELMGHKSIEMTLRYAHLIPDQKKAAVKELVKQFKMQHNSASANNDIENSGTMQ